MFLNQLFSPVKLLTEGGNVSSKSPGWVGMPGDHAAQEIDLKLHDRDYMVGQLRTLLQAQNESFKAAYGRYIWDPKTLAGNRMFSGSSLHFFDVKGISTQDFLNKLKKNKVGDIDTQVDQEIADDITAWLKSVIGKKIGNATFVGFNSSLSSLWQLEDPPVKVQVDYEMGAYDPKTKAPTEWFAYSHSSDYADLAAGIKGVFHKYLNRALTHTQSSTKYVARVLKKSTKISPEPQTDSDYSFAVTGPTGGGLSAKYKPYVDPETGEPKEINDVPVMQLLEPAQRDYIQNLDKQFQHFYGRKPTAGDRKLQNSFVGTIQLMNQTFKPEQNEAAARAFLDILFGQGAQMISAGDPVRDRDIKFAAIDAMLLGGEGVKPLKLPNAKSLRQEAVNMAMAYEQAKSQSKKKSVTEAEAPNYSRQGIKHVFNRLPDGRVSSMEMKDNEFIDLCKEIAENGGTLNSAGVNLKVDGAGIRFGKDSSGEPFFMTSRVNRPLTKKDIGTFTRYGTEQGQEGEQLARTKAYDSALSLIVNSEFIEKLPEDTIVQAEMLYNPMAEKTAGGLKFVNIPYDPKKLGGQMTLVPFMVKTYSSGQARPDEDQIIKSLVDSSSPSVKIISNRLEQKGINVGNIIRPVLNLDPKNKQANKPILDKARQELSNAIINSPQLKGKDMLGSNMEGIVINMPSGRLFKVTSSQMKTAMAAKQQGQEYDKTPRTAVVAIGNFAGHRGHEQLIQNTINKAKEVGGTPFVFVGRKVGPDDPIDINTKLETLKKLFPSVDIRLVTDQIGPGGVTMKGDIFKKVEAELVKKPPFYNNIILSTGKEENEADLPLEKTAMGKRATGMQTRFSGYAPLAHVKVSSFQSPRSAAAGGTGISTTQLRDALRNLPEDQAFKVWSQAYNVKKLGADYIKHLMDVARQNMGLSKVQQPQPNQPQPNQPPAKEMMAPPSGPTIPASGHLSLESYLREGGWETTATQSTVITPSVVKAALSVMQKNFVPDFNQYLQSQNIPPIKVGHPTGSSAHYERDAEGEIYGDIDLQIIVPEIEGKNTTGERQAFWGSMIIKFIRSSPGMSYLHPNNVGMIMAKEVRGPVLKVGPEKFIQIDIMPHTEKLSQWGRYRATAEPGLKGLLQGNIFSVLSTIFDVNLQHSGLQYKTQGGQKVNYTNTRKDYQLQTIGTNIATFVMDLFKHEVGLIKPSKAQIDPLLKQYPGVKPSEDPNELRVFPLVNAVKGLARSFEASDMYGQGDLANFTSAEDFLNKFLGMYMEKAKYAIENKKRDKAVTPQAVERAKQDRQKIAQGAGYVQYLFQNDGANLSYKEYLQKRQAMSESKKLQQNLIEDSDEGQWSVECQGKEYPCNDQDHAMNKARSLLNHGGKVTVIKQNNIPKYQWKVGQRIEPLDNKEQGMGEAEMVQTNLKPGDEVACDAGGGRTMFGVVKRIGRTMIHVQMPNGEVPAFLPKHVELATATYWQDKQRLPKKQKPQQGKLAEKIKGVDGKACWKGKRYAGRVKKADGTYKDKCVPVGESWEAEITKLIKLLENK